jgi:hypothetical protein
MACHYAQHLMLGITDSILDGPSMRLFAKCDDRFGTIQANCLRLQPRKE